MLDVKSKLVLKILAKETSGGSYKIFESEDIISLLPKRFRTDSEGIRHILTHLERQDFISIKYDDDDTYCLCVLPFGFEEVEDAPVKERGRVNKLTILFPSFLGFWVRLLVGLSLFFSSNFFRIKCVF